jgi:hypothetical protein
MSPDDFSVLYAAAALPVAGPETPAPWRSFLSNDPIGASWMLAIGTYASGAR